MSIAPHELWSERFEQIGTTIERNAETLTERFGQRATKELRDGAPAHRNDMRDRLPDLLRVMGRSLARSENSIPAAHTMLALEHGEQRWQIGWRLAEVIRDYQILRLVILEYLDEVLANPLQTRECMAIGLALDEAISASVLAYVGFQEAQLRDANRRLTDFLPVLGHELRNPLSAIVGAMELARMSQTSGSMLREAHDIIDRQVEQMTRLVNDMSDVSRIIRGQLELRQADIDLREVIDQSIEATRALIADREQELTVVVAPDPLWMHADAARLRQVIGNLLTNASKYTPTKGRIWIEAGPADGMAVLRVRDNGVGITPSLLPTIFDMFAQGPEHKHQGLGIGLALVRALVELHGGTVTASSLGAQRGSEFQVKLPLANSSPQPLAAGRGTFGVTPSPCFRILLVDDHRDGAQTLAVLLERCGHEVQLAQDAKAALAVIEKFQPTAILIDIGLPGMDGYELARQLRQNTRFTTTPLVAVTGYATEEDRQAARAAGFNHHLSKPIELEAIQKLLASLVRTAIQLDDK